MTIKLLFIDLFANSGGLFFVLSYVLIGASFFLTLLHLQNHTLLNNLLLN